VKLKRNDHLIIPREKILQVSEEYSKLLGVQLSYEFVSEKLFEELGEFAKISLVHRGICRDEKRLLVEESKYLLGDELADILGWLVTAAAVYEIDIQKHLEEKWLSKVKNSNDSEVTPAN
jgi:NTP pyrophosphatase (non-canonical NTP hydrolase)